MMKANLRFWVLTVPFLCIACAGNVMTNESVVGTHSATQTASVVKIVKNATAYQLTVNGKPYQVKGVGLNYPEGHDFEALKQTGGNTFRTWSSQYADLELAAAKKHGLMVAMGFDLQKELHGFDYNNEAAVAKQFADFKQVIQKYKNHPNLLAWVIGNEPNLLLDEKGGLKMVNPKVYEALSDMIDYVHAVDPNHPVTYSFAGVIPEHIHTAMQYTPQVDFISVQVYADVAGVNTAYANLNIDKPFMVTEFGPVGHWERPPTAWGREIEEPSSVAAAGMAERIRTGLHGNKGGKNIGTFAFLWGQKQERTPTWYSMFHKDGSQTERIDELTKYWTGEYPANRAPQVHAININGILPEQNIYLKPGQNSLALVKHNEPDGDPVTCNWVIMKEVDERSDGGAFEKEPEEVAFAINEKESNCQQGKLAFVVPEKTGDYRLFVYIYDGKGKVGYANAPLFVKP
ncbi:MAG: DUF4038 domain-containing protein [Gammaproteobacteria bacterium]|nr:DUF4038 domain-containing protein [Gammaproteobacteria bacterium]NNC98469.1 DUF4038 domain-containing protein [Gammaproteobacteria bacterium]NNM14776.1 DUF4038 domain-containing protein [Gammaproteobacteria bacterium]